MCPEPQIPPEKTGLIIRGSSGLAVTPITGLSALSEIVSRSLVHIQTSKAQWVLHRIGNHDLYGPDYRLVCAWAEELKMTEEEVLTSLLSGHAMFRTTLTEGHFRILNINSVLPIVNFPSIAGLMIERLDLGQSVDLSGLKPKSFSNLIELSCVGLELQELDLSPFHSLEKLQCQDNQLTQIDLSCVPNLLELLCWDNQIKELDLSPVKRIKVLWCGDNQLAGIDLSKSSNLEDLRYWNNPSTNLDISNLTNLKVLGVTGMGMTSLDLSANPILSELYCSNNQLTDLDLSVVPNLEKLECCENPLAELDIRPLINLGELLHSGNSLCLIQRPDQNFK